MSEPEKLERGLGLVEATSLNMTFMVGIGPFVVIPFVIQAMRRAGESAGVGGGSGHWRFSMAASGPNWARRCRRPAEATFTCAKRTARSAGDG